MRPQLAEQDQMTIEESLEFTATRPDDERWELIEGVPVLNAMPSDFDQLIATNILYELRVIGKETGAAWRPLIGVATRVPVSPRSLPQPDVMVKAQPGSGDHTSKEALVLFEVLSPSNTPSDQAWRRKVYASIPNLEHYVVVAQRKVSITRHDRATGWLPVRLEDIDDTLDLPALGGSIPLGALYRGTPHTTRA
jgi:Uma2 family endonuclease